MPSRKVLLRLTGEFSMLFREARFMFCNSSILDRVKGEGRRGVPSAMPKAFSPLAALLIVLFVAFALFPIPPYYDDLYSLEGRYLMSDNEDEDQGSDNRDPILIVSVFLPEILAFKLRSSCWLQKDGGLSFPCPTLFSHLNRAPPLAN